MQFIEAANHWNGRLGYSPRWIIVHGTAGGTSAQNIADFFANQAQDPATGSSTNYVIGTDGEVVMCVREGDAPWANGAVTGPGGTSGDGIGNGYHDSWWDNEPNPNLVTISIEHCKPDQYNQDQITDAQKRASFQLIKDICQRNNIPVRKADAHGGITGHYSIDPVNRQNCPGPYPWNELWAYLKGNEDTPMQITDTFASRWFKDLGQQRWQCKNGKMVVGAILKFYCMIQGTARLPHSDEIKSIAGVSYQEFEGCIIVYDPQHKLDNPGVATWWDCYLLKLDDPLAQQIMSKPLVDEVSSLKGQVTAEEKSIADLRSEIVALKAAQPVDKTALTTDLTNATNYLSSALAKLK